MVLLRQGNGHAAGLPPGHNGDLGNGVLIGQGVHDHSMARLVEGRQLPLMLRDDPAAFFRTGNDLDLRILQVLHGDIGLVLPGRQQSRLIDEVFQIRSGESCRSLGQPPQIHVLCQRLSPGVDLQNLLPAPDIRQAHIDLPVEPAGPQQGRVQHIGPVGRRQDHHALVGGKSVHLHQKLVQGLLPLVMAAAQSGTPLAAHGVDLVNKHNGGRGLFPSSTPLGMRAPRAMYFCGSFRNSTIS